MTPGPAATWTILTVLKWAQTYLDAKGISEPRAGAEVLLAHCLHCNRLELYLRHDQPLSDTELHCYKTLLKRRLADEPTQYITGHQEFWSLDFLVDPGVLIPRPETEVLAEAVLAQVKPQAPEGAGRRILDVGTGSGVLAVVLARELPQARVVGLDRSWRALLLARENARRQGVAEQTAWVLGDLAAALAPRGLFDVIVSNPPYVATADWERLPRQIREYEPRLALDGGPDGLDVIRALAATAPARLRPEGLLALEVGQGQAEAVLELLEAQGGYEPGRILPDYQRIGRVVLARRRGG